MTFDVVLSNILRSVLYSVIIDVDDSIAFDYYWDVWRSATAASPIYTTLFYPRHPTILTHIAIHQTINSPLTLTTEKRPGTTTTRQTIYPPSRFHIANRSEHA